MLAVIINMNHELSGIPIALHLYRHRLGMADRLVVGISFLSDISQLFLRLPACPCCFLHHMYCFALTE